MTTSQRNVCENTFNKALIYTSIIYCNIIILPIINIILCTMCGAQDTKIL